MSKKTHRKHRQRATPSAVAAKKSWRAYGLGLLVIVGLVVAFAAMKNRDVIPNPSRKSIATARPSPPPPAPVAETQTQKAAPPEPSKSQTLPAKPSAVQIPAPKSELERIAQSAALATVARISSRGGVAYAGFPLPSLQGVMLGPANYPGRVVLVNFWATWCGPCKKEIPDLMDLQAEYHARGLEVLGVSLDGSTDVVRPYADNAGINYTVLIGNADTGRQHDVTAIPTTLLFDRQGKIAKRLVGIQSRESLEAAIRSLL